VSDHLSLAELDGALPFVDRHIGLRPEDIDTMLAKVGFESLEELMAAAVPRPRARSPWPGSCGSAPPRTTRRRP
jgi:glycine cleavage system pyridoxal-binding protein P